VDRNVVFNGHVTETSFVMGADLYARLKQYLIGRLERIRKVRLVSAYNEGLSICFGYGNR